MYNLKLYYIVNSDLLPNMLTPIIVRDNLRIPEDSTLKDVVMVIKFD